MADNTDRITRSRVMSRIRGYDTNPEMTVRRFLHRAGLRFRLHSKDLPGTPDIVLPRWNTVVLVHGCFWHRHSNCHRAYMPKSNIRFWADKFAANIQRDRRKSRELKQLGWRVIVIWECALSPRQLGRLVRKIRQ